MSLNQEQKDKIVNVIIESVRKKLARYNPESKYMPFHYRLLGKDRMALYSFIQSLKTTFITSIFEPVAQAIAEENYKIAVKQYNVGNEITDLAQQEIHHIINELSVGNILSNKKQEIERIRTVATEGKVNRLKTAKVDLYLEDYGGKIYLFDLKTVKPNIGEFKSYKRTLLEWIAILLYKNPDAQVNSYIAMAYNPYYPKPYERWTLKGMLDIENELLIAEEFWNFLGKDNIFDQLLDCFSIAGNKLRPELDRFFAKFK